ncbi:hypothetical protein CCYA_CCYA03G0983 [Cyanidiococcus yangmingshanensis]|nr:hypothetical protein CCYA_CCYA03G0983 [Cyanidiococcus yangmingshanensis]
MELSHWTIHMQTNARILLRNDWLREDRTLLAAWCRAKPRSLSISATLSSPDAVTETEQNSPRWSFGIHRPNEVHTLQQQSSNMAHTSMNDRTHANTAQVGERVPRALFGSATERRIGQVRSQTETGSVPLIRKRKHTGSEPSTRASQCSGQAGRQPQRPAAQDIDERQALLETDRSVGNEVISRDECHSVPKAVMSNVTLIVIGCETVEEPNFDQERVASDHGESNRLRLLWEELGGCWLDHRDLDRVYALLEGFASGAASGHASIQQESDRKLTSLQLRRHGHKRRRNTVHDESPQSDTTIPFATPIVVVAPYHQHIGEQLCARQPCALPNLAMQQLYALACIAWQRGWANVIKVTGTAGAPEPPCSGTSLLARWMKNIWNHDIAHDDRPKRSTLGKAQVIHSVTWTKEMLQACPSPNRRGVFADCSFMFAHEDCNSKSPIPQSRRTRQLSAKANPMMTPNRETVPSNEAGWQENAARLIRIAGGVCLGTDTEHETARAGMKANVSSRRGGERPSAVNPVSSGLRFRICRKRDVDAGLDSSSADSNVTWVDWPLVLATACTGAMDSSLFRTKCESSCAEATAVSATNMTRRVTRKRHRAEASLTKPTPETRRSRRR